MKYDCIIIGGGIAGLQAAIQLGRYKHNILIIDANNGRSNLCRAYHNILGWPEGISGQKLREIGKYQALQLGVQFENDTVINISKHKGLFQLSGESGDEYYSECILLATGVMDRIPNLPDIYPCLGISVYVCPDCDGYEVSNKRTIVIGSGNVGANMALALYYWTHEIVYINHEKKWIDSLLLDQLLQKGIEIVEKSVQKVVAEDSYIKGVLLEDGNQIMADKGFIALGGNHVKSELASQLGVEIMDNKHIIVDPRTKMTNVRNVWAAGDVVAHSEQVTIAMGEGSQAAIWIHKSLMKNGRN